MKMHSKKEKILKKETEGKADIEVMFLKYNWIIIKKYD